MLERVTSDVNRMIDMGSAVVHTLSQNQSLQEIHDAMSPLLEPVSGAPVPYAAMALTP